MKIAILQNVPSPYREGLFRQLAMIPGVDLEVLYYSKSRKGREWKVETNGYAHHFLSGICIGKYNHINPSIISRIISGRYDAVLITGYNSITSILAAISAKLVGSKSFIWSATIPNQSNADPSTSWVAKTAKRLLLFFFDGGFVTSQLAKEYLHSIYPDLNTFFARNSIDTKKVSRSSIAGKKSAGVFFKKINSSAQFHFLYVGHLTEQKGVHILLKAFESLAYKYNHIGLLLVGSGPLSSQASRMKNVHCLGFLHDEELYEIYGMADAFVFPTFGDSWGLVINEAIAANLPIIASCHSGAAVSFFSEHGKQIFFPDEINTYKAMKSILNQPNQMKAQIDPNSFDDSTVAMEIFSQLKSIANG